MKSLKSSQITPFKGPNHLHSLFPLLLSRIATWPLTHFSMLIFSPSEANHKLPIGVTNYVGSRRWSATCTALLEPPTVETPRLGRSPFVYVTFLGGETRYSHLVCDFQNIFLEISPPSCVARAALQIHTQINGQCVYFSVTPHGAIRVVQRRFGSISDELRGNKPKNALVTKNAFQ